MQPALKGTGGNRGVMEHLAPLAPQPVPRPLRVPCLWGGLLPPAMRAGADPWVQLLGWQHKRRVKWSLVCREGWLGSHPLPGSQSPHV